MLRFGGPGAPKAFGADVDLVPGQRGESFGSFNLCLAGPGRATVTGVEAVSAHGVRVATWSVRDGEAMGLGTSPNGLVAEGFPRDPAPVRVVCPREGGKDPGVFPSELGVRLELDGVSGSATGLRVRYEADGRDGVLVIPFTVRMAPA